MVDSTLSVQRKVAQQNVLDGVFRAATWGFAVFVLLLLCGIILSLLNGAIPALETFGLKFFVDATWNPANDVFGGLGPIAGTLITSLIAMLFGIPLSFGIAIFITQLAPVWMKRPLSIAIELLAGIPSIIYGIWGLFVLVPFMKSNILPFLIDTVGRIPGLGMLFQGPPFGTGILTAGLVLAIMVLPFITSITRDVFETVPSMLKESARAVGATTWETVRDVILPYTRIGVVGGVMLGLGRALGETMAVTFVVGNAHRLSTSILQPGTTISAALANEFNEAAGTLYPSSLILLGLVLFVITFIVLTFAKLMLQRLEAGAK